mgnify:CR=1 FL=1
MERLRAHRRVPAALALPAQAQEGDIITKQYDDGSVYEGTFLNGRQHGMGTYRLPSGFTYAGEWVEGEITGVLRVEALRQRLDKHMETARLKQVPLSLLCIQLDQAQALREGSGEVGAAAGLRPVAELLLEEIEYGDVIGRSGPDGFLVVAPGRRLLQARDYAERLRAAISRLRIDPRISPVLSVSVGVAQAGPDERDPAGIVERAARAAQIANKNGGNQIFS